FLGTSLINCLTNVFGNILNKVLRTYFCMIIWMGGNIQGEKKTAGALKRDAFAPARGLWFVQHALDDHFGAKS
ncbi:hypothetical protein, partial [Desulfatibacillum alkenivorans]|uniref:hypothetical protein n=1 Tax=Desulfatibacillum alkenivorans TaxID=259354 RepID=UPI001B8BD9B0